VSTPSDHNFTNRVAAKWLRQSIHEKVAKSAKVTGDKKWGGEHVGLFIPLPKRLAKQFPSLGGEDTSPSHVTFLYLGTVKSKKDQECLLEALKEIKSDWPKVTATLDGLSHFDHADKDRRVAHVEVKFDKDVAGMRKRIKQDLIDGGVSVEDNYPDYNPHVTLAYMPGKDTPDYDGKIPEGKWDFDEMELWGLPKIHKIPLGPKPNAVAASWAHRRFVAAANRVLQRPGVKTAGWWAINGQKPPVDKGPLMNAIPGCDPADAAMYNGDGPADHTGSYLDEIDIMYRTVWGRPAHPEELQAVFNFCFRPIEDGVTKLNEWFDGFIDWFGTPATEITWSLEVWDKISWFFLQLRNQKYMGGVALPSVWQALDVVKDDLKRLNDLEYSSDTDTGSKFHDAVLMKLDTLRDYWLDTMFPRQLNESEQRLVKRISENWFKGCMR